MGRRELTVLYVRGLTLILVMWRIWWAPNNASRWQKGFNSAFKRLMLNRHRDTSVTCWISIRIYYQKECNDVAVCRMWSYGRSSMVGKSPDCGATVVSQQPQHALILNMASFYRTPPSPNPSQEKFSDHANNTHDWKNTDHAKYTHDWFPLPIIYRPGKNWLKWYMHTL